MPAQHMAAAVVWMMLFELSRTVGVDPYEPALAVNAVRPFAKEVGRSKHRRELADDAVDSGFAQQHHFRPLATRFEEMAAVVAVRGQAQQMLGVGNPMGAAIGRQPALAPVDLAEVRPQIGNEKPCKLDVRTDIENIGFAATAIGRRSTAPAAADELLADEDTVLGNEPWWISGTFRAILWVTHRWFPPSLRAARNLTPQ